MPNVNQCQIQDEEQVSRLCRKRTRYCFIRFTKEKTEAQKEEETF